MLAKCLWLNADLLLKRQQSIHLALYSTIQKNTPAMLSDSNFHFGNPQQTVQRHRYDYQSW